MLSKRENEKEHIFTIEDCHVMFNHRSVFLSELIGSNELVFNQVSHRNLNCTACINSITSGRKEEIKHFIKHVYHNNVNLYSCCRFVLFDATVMVEKLLTVFLN